MKVAGEAPKSLAVAERGIRTSGDLVDFLGQLLGDVVSERVDYATAQSACLVAEKIIHVADLHARTLGEGGQGFLGAARTLNGSQPKQIAS